MVPGVSLPLRVRVLWFFQTLLTYNYETKQATKLNKPQIKLKIYPKEFNYSTRVNMSIQIM